MSKTLAGDVSTSKSHETGWAAFTNLFLTESEKRVMSDFLEARYEKDPSIVYREIAGEAVLVPIRRNVADLDSIYTLDEVGASVWKLVTGDRTVGDIVAAILAEYDVDPQTAQSDVIGFLQQLEEIGAIRGT